MGGKVVKILLDNEGLINYINENYSYSDGCFYFKNHHQPYLNGKCVGTINFHKRWTITIKGYTYFRSRLVFLLHKGYMPKFVDHKDLDKLNDRIDNLRDATRLENNCNKGSYKNSTSKYKGVNYRIRKGRNPFWEAKIQYNNTSLWIGQYKNRGRSRISLQSRGCSLS